MSRSRKDVLVRFPYFRRAWFGSKATKEASNYYSFWGRNAYYERGGRRPPEAKEDYPASRHNKDHQRDWRLLATDPTDIGELEETFDILLLKEASLKELDKEIELSVEYDALEEEISGAEGYAERISVTKTRVNRKLKGQEFRNDRASGSSTHGSGSGQTPVDHGQLPTTVKLQKLYCCAFLLF